jgi:bifunctional N-acetylglucosamine-1-phosphate-uridyltransferase/glucosamine-1-phosphate-acetyltransferase GlmU-like protein
VTEGRLSLIVMAAGSGVRFGGVKQLAPIRPNGEVILDALLARAASGGFTRAAVVTSPAIEQLMRDHLAAHPPQLPVEVVLQLEPTGTADAVLSARDVVEGSFGVVNADDLYPPEAFAMLAEELSRGGERALVAFQVGRTLIGTRPVKRALLDFDDDGRLVALRETTVVAGSRELQGDVWVSMNMWGFSHSMFDVLTSAVDDFNVSRAAGEILLPDVVSSLVAEGVTVRVLRCDQPCIGITYAEDVEVVRGMVE